MREGVEELQPMICHCDVQPALAEFARPPRAFFLSAAYVLKQSYAEMACSFPGVCRL